MDWAAVGAAATALLGVIGFIAGRRWERVRVSQAYAETGLAVAQTGHEYVSIATAAMDLAKSLQGEIAIERAARQNVESEIVDLRKLLFECKRMGKMHERRWELAEPLLARCADHDPDLAAAISELKFSISTNGG